MHTIFFVQVLVCVNWALCLALLLALTYGLYPYHSDARLVSPPEIAALYAAAARLAWGAGVAWVAFACLTGWGGE